MPESLSQTNTWMLVAAVAAAAATVAVAVAMFVCMLRSRSLTQWRHPKPHPWQEPTFESDMVKKRIALLRHHATLPPTDRTIDEWLLPEHVASARRVVQGQTYFRQSSTDRPEQDGEQKAA